MTFKIFLTLFILGCGRSSLRMGLFSSYEGQGPLSGCGMQASRCGAFSSRGAEALVLWAAVASACGLSIWGSRALEHRLAGCGAQAYLLCGMRDLPGSGIEPVSSALAGRFFTTEPPRKPEGAFHPRFPLVPGGQNYCPMV